LLSLDLRGVRNTYFIDVSNIYIAKEPISETIARKKETVSGEELQKNRQKIYVHNSLTQKIQIDPDIYTVMVND
jgi:urease alpha subunit